jgi:glucokinase
MYLVSMILGIDIGGTSAKFGLVQYDGTITETKRYQTADWVNGDGFMEGLLEAIADFLSTYPNIKGIGLGWPGLLSADRQEVLFLPNIPSVANMPVMRMLEEAFPGILCRMENDAKCAAMGEYYFGKEKRMANFLLVVMGTGVGSGAIINHKLFIGGSGNGTEIGHMLTHTGKTLEEQSGLAQITKRAKEIILEDPFRNSSLHTLAALDPKLIQEHAEAGDAAALEVYREVGSLLGEVLVNVVRVLDIHTVLLGGGVSAALHLMKPEIMKQIHTHLPEYYTRNFDIRAASLYNDAGLLGAAGLIME